MTPQLATAAHSEQRARVGVRRRAHQLFARALLDDAHGLHHRDLNDDVLNDTNVVRDEQVSQAELAQQRLDEVQDLRRTLTPSAKANRRARW